MNFLAHSYLSPKKPKVMLGNLVGDFIKGKITNELDNEIAEGAKIHREIDVFTDTHPIVLDTKKIVRNEFGLYSGVIIDMFFDHILAKKWKQNSSYSFQNHIQKVYLEANTYLNQLPEKFHEVLPIMINYNWLDMYASEEGLAQILKQMSRRIKRNVDLENSMHILNQHNLEIEKNFEIFWTEISNQFEFFTEEELEI